MTVTMLTDEEIKKEVVDELFWDSRVNAADVKVDVLNREVTLTGQLPSLSACSAAVTDTWTISDVRNVHDQLTISPARDLPTDLEIQKRVQDTLLWNPDINSIHITPTVLAGVVTLRGTVDAYWKKIKAENLISEMHGVVHVQNEIAIVPTSSVVDKDIAKNIERELKRNIYVNAEDVTVEVDHARVRLTGLLPSWYARTRAEDSAAFTPGVEDVVNDIVVA